jgi:2-polyprenyl-6-methoxyphenol hydroxylase-like FAD-dependent oxidoreductase
MKATIIGAGIAGTAAAVFFKRAGIHVELYEQRQADTGDEGQFLSIAPNGLTVLDQLGLGEEVRRAGLLTKTLEFSNDAGRSLGSVELGGPGQASYTLKRAELHRILRHEVSRMGVEIRYGMKLRQVEQSSKVRALFQNGEDATSDLLVGCDGIHSQVRRALFPESPKPSPTGLIGSGGFSYCPHLQPTPFGMKMIFGRRAFFGYMVSQAREVYWFSTFDSSALQTGPADASTQLRRTLLELHAHDGTEVVDIIRESRGSISAYEIHDIPTLTQWVQRNAIVVGDASHATSPHGGQGASMALEDAWSLSEVLRARPSVEPIELALLRFQRLRQPRVERVVQWSRRNGMGKAPSTSLQRWIRDLVMPIVLRLSARPGAHSWLYDFRMDVARPDFAH